MQKSQLGCSPHIHTLRGMPPLRSPGNSRHAVGGETEDPKCASGSDTPGGHGKFGPSADSAAGLAPQRVSWLGPAPTGTCPQRTPPPHSGRFQETVTSFPRPRFSLTGCTSGCDSQRWISARALHLEWGAQSPERATCPPGRGNGGCCPHQLMPSSSMGRLGLLD